MQRTKDKVRGNGGIALALFVAGLALVLTCRKWDNPLDPTGDHPPTVPSHPSPADSGLGSDSGLVLSWQSHDPDSGDTAYFDIFFDTASPPRLVRAGWTDTTYQPTNVVDKTRYYWRIIAYDNHSDSAVGPLWQFRTAAMLDIKAPDTGEQLRMYSRDTITWTGGPTVSRRTPNATHVTLASNSGNRLASGATRRAPVGTGALDSTVVFRSTDDGTSWIRLGRATTPNRFVWQVPAPATDSARVRVLAYASGDTLFGVSGRFEIYDTMPPSAIAVTAPDSTVGWTIGSVHDVTWLGGTGSVDSSVIYFSSDNGGSWTRQGRATTQGIFAWTVPGPATASAKIEVRAYNPVGMTTGSSSTFQVI